jgi:uncharacterized protein
MEFALWVYPLLFAIGVAAGLVDSIAGGGGLIALPVLLMLGLPVPVALATNKFQSLCGVSSSAWNYTRRGLVDLRACRLGVAATFIGAVAGVLVVQKTDTHLLGRLIPWLLAVILVYTIFRPKLGENDQPPRMGTKAFFIVAGLGLGFYDGFFGPGVGSLWTIALIVGLGQNFTKATAYTKVMNLTSNVASVALFSYAGLMNYPAGITMGAGQIIGGQLGSNMVMRKGVRFIRPIFLTIVTLTLIRLVWVNYR